MNTAVAPYDPGLAIPGLRLRPVRDPADYAPMVAVYDACAIVDDLDRVVTVGDIAAFLENPANCDPEHDWVIVEISGRVVAYAWIDHRVEAAGGEVHQHRGYVHPAWRRRGIGRALLRRIWERSARVRLGDSPELQRFVQSFVHEGEQDAVQLLTRLGYASARYFLKMRRSLAEPIPRFPLPHGVELRTAGRQDFRAVWESQHEAFRDGWGYAPWTESHYRRFASFPHYDPELWCVAWHGERVVGSVLNYINREENRRLRRRLGYTEHIAVVREWRGRGLASTLIALSLERLRDLGMTEAGLGADLDSPTGAQRLYQRLGYRTESHMVVYRRDLPDGHAAA